MYTGQTKSATMTDKEPVLEQIKRRKWNWLGYVLQRIITALPNKYFSGLDTTRPQKKSATKEHLEKRSIYLFI